MNKTSIQVIIIIVVLAIIVAGMFSLTTLFPRKQRSLQLHLKENTRVLGSLVNKYMPLKLKP